MKKVAIYTIQTHNYGNRLQNYATQEVLKKLSFSPITIKNMIPNDILSNTKRIIKKTFFTDRRASFFKFDDNIKYERKSFNVNQVSKYHAFLVGSDQVWNTTFKFITDDFFLPFSHNKKIAFSASFGLDSIPYDEHIADYLNDFKALSVREDSGVRIIKEFTGRDSTVLVDPTMLLSKNEWRTVSKKPKGAKEGYILTYFLSPKCDDAAKKLEDIKGGREVYELLNPNDEIAGKAGPSEFLWLIEHADMILTDSFHACVFSFLFGKPFIVYDRNWNEGNMNSRLKTLLSKFHLERKYASSGLENDLWEHDYSEGYKQLETEREKAFTFLRNALED